MSNLITAQRAAKLLGLKDSDQAFVRGFIWLGILPAQKNGNAWVISHDDLENFCSQFQKQLNNVDSEAVILN